MRAPLLPEAVVAFHPFGPKINLTKSLLFTVPLPPLIFEAAFGVSSGAGLHCPLALALALALPENLPQRESVISVSLAVAAFSTFVQGLTMKPMLRMIRRNP